jgi:hypothetical protein
MCIVGRALRIGPATITDVAANDNFARHCLGRRLRVSNLSPSSSHADETSPGQVQVCSVATAVFASRENAAVNFKYDHNRKESSILGLNSSSQPSRSAPTANRSQDSLA